MNICVVSPSYPTAKTIDFVFVDQLCRAIAKEGHQVSIIAPQSITKAIMRRVPIVKRSTVVRVDGGIDIKLFRPIYLSFGNVKILAWLNRIGFNTAVAHTFNKSKTLPDVCYGHFWEAAYSIYSSAKKNNIPLFVSSGEELITIRINYSQHKLKEFLEYISGIISVSQKNKDEIIQAGLANEQNVRVIPNAVDPTMFFKKNRFTLREELGYDQEYFIVAFVGQFAKRKGANRLSSAMTSLADHSIKAFFIGNGPELPDYEGIIFKDRLPHERLSDFLNCADIFVLPTDNEGCSNAIIEAMACGLPIVSSDLPFNHDILNKNNALLVDPYNVSEIASAIKTLKDDYALRMKMSENSHATALDLTLPKRAQKIIEYIKNLTS
jgi:teichuronic acid biosynthesis glycosyltransferase TuaC